MIDTFFKISIVSSYISISTIIPISTPTKYIIDRIVMFSFMFLLFLNYSNMPSPLPVKSPLKSVPIVIRLDKYNSVIITLDAQLGIRPIKLAIK